MAPRGSKRAAAQVPAEEPGAKRVSDFLSKQGVSKASYQPVLEALQHPLSGLSEGECRMLLAVLPWSLVVPADERHEAQEAAVHTVEGVMEHVRAELEKAASTESDKVDELNAKRAEDESAIQRTEADDVRTRQALEECRARLAEVEAGVPQKRAALEQAKLEQERLNTDLEQTQGQATELEGMLSGSFAKLKDASYEDDEAEGLVQAVLSSATKVSLEESMIATLPASLAKRERGSFDQAVICEAEAAFQGKLATIRSAAEAAKAPAAAQAELVQAAQAEFDAELANQSEAADGLRCAEEASAEAIAAAKAAKLALAETDVKITAAATAQSEKQIELEHFCTYNMSLYKVLRDRKAPRQQETENPEDSAEPDVAASKDSVGEQLADAVSPVGGA